ncbi:sterol carrier family protein [Ketogulonicigenium robustum]|uniref:Sterol carrier family protein n=1 Tax=Ketogulonicigenium robustum TaxID=92947 RepID=A0A1W6NY60_9RHOB|nr:SCP2 sterol-binding domain-containing protein [Ketogulonicigenium robustum]ARO13957.1 sterol carrier family protein [Ketogulonicigenium robustum]
MSEFLDKVAALLKEKIAGQELPGSVKLTIDGRGSVVASKDGVTMGDAPADVTLSASEDVLKALLDGQTNPVTAFMTGKLKVDGDMGLAMKLSTLFA